MVFLFACVVEVVRYGVLFAVYGRGGPICCFCSLCGRGGPI